MREPTGSSSVLRQGPSLLALAAVIGALVGAGLPVAGVAG